MMQKPKQRMPTNCDVRIDVGYCYRAKINCHANLVLTGEQQPRLWDLTSGSLRQLLRTGKKPGDYADWDIALTPDGNHALASFSDVCLRLWDTNSAKQVLHWDTDIFATAASGMDAINNRVLIGCGWTKVLLYYDLSTGGELMRMKSRTSSTETVALSNDGKFALSGGGDKRVHLWDLASGQRIVELPGHTGRVMAVRFGKAGKIAISASADRTVAIWDLKKASRITTLSGPTRIISCLALSPNGKWVATGDRSGAVWVWSLSDGRSRMIEDHSEAVLDVAFTPDSKAVVSIDPHGHIWTRKLSQK